MDGKEEESKLDEAVHLWIIVGYKSRWPFPSKRVEYHLEGTQFAAFNEVATSKWERAWAYRIICYHETQ